MKSVTINKNDAQMRIDKFLTKYLKSMPKSLIYKYIRKKRIKVNGNRTSIDYILQKNDIVDMYINDEFFVAKNKKISPVSLKDLNIIFEDKNIMIIDKKPGLLSHSNSEDDETLINMIWYYLYKKGAFKPSKENTFSPALCNRLDRNTGGIIIAAKNAESLRYINEKIKNNEVKKYYLCAVNGVPKKESSILKGYCIKDFESNTLKIVGKDIKNSKEIITKYNLINSKNDISLLEVELVTGRSHQIRAHLSHIGHPIVGDVKYGGKPNANIKTRHQCLYSYKVAFDFHDSNNTFNYLKNKEFKITEVDFVQYFI